MISPTRILKAPISALARGMIAVLRRVADEPVMIGKVEQLVQWKDQGYETHETITFFLYETRSGVRTWKVHKYGWCKTFDTDKKYLGAILYWSKGGPLPRGFEPLAASISAGGSPNLRVVK